MSYYVARHTGWGWGSGSPEAPYVVRRSAPYSEVEDVVKTFTGQSRETDGQIRARAQAWCDRLNAGGVSREQALREGEK